MYAITLGEDRSIVCYANIMEERFPTSSRRRRMEKAWADQESTDHQALKTKVNSPHGHPPLLFVQKTQDLAVP